MSEMKTPWTLDGGTIRDIDGEAVGVFMGNGGYAAAARWPKAEHAVRCVNNHMEDTEKRTRRGDLAEPLGGQAGCGGDRYVYCGDCSPEPLDYMTAVRMKIRKVGLGMAGDYPNIDVIECPECGRQILR